MSLKMAKMRLKMAKMRLKMAKMRPKMTKMRPKMANMRFKIGKMKPKMGLLLILMVNLKDFEGRKRHRQPTCKSEVGAGRVQGGCREGAGRVQGTSVGDRLPLSDTLSRKKYKQMTMDKI